MGIPHYFTDPHCPKQNGRVERLHQTAEYEYFNYKTDLRECLADVNKRCMAFNTKYNYHRYHQALGYQKPAEYVKLLQKNRKEKCTVSWQPAQLFDNTIVVLYTHFNQE